MNDEKLRIIGGLIIAVILIYPVFAFGMELVNSSKAGKAGEERAKNSSSFQESVLNKLPNMILQQRKWTISMPEWKKNTVHNEAIRIINTWPN